MRTKILSLIAVIAITLSAQAEQVEFRLVTLNGESVSDKRIKELLVDGGIGLEQCYTVPVEDGRFMFDDTREVRYPTEFSKDGVVIKKKTIKLGATIIGKAKKTGGVRSLDFHFNYCEKNGDQVNTLQNGIAFVTPKFTRVGIKMEWSLEKVDNSWTITKFSNRDKAVNQYLAFRLR